VFLSTLQELELQWRHLRFLQTFPALSSAAPLPAEARVSSGAAQHHGRRRTAHRCHI
jgi:hypothetical protein